VKQIIDSFEVQDEIRISFKLRWAGHGDQLTFLFYVGHFSPSLGECEQYIMIYLTSMVYLLAAM